MYITQNLNEKLKVPVMWKLSTAFFPCSKEAFTRTPGPSECHCCVRLSTAPVQSEPSGAAGNDLRDGPDRTKAEALLGREPHHRHGSEGDTGTCCGTVPTVTVSLCCAFAAVRSAAARLLGH